MRRNWHRWYRIGLAISAALMIAPEAFPQQDFNFSPTSFQEKWQLFGDETFDPLASGAAGFNASFSQVTLSDPKYGAGAGAGAQRFGASLADIATQNFFGDFVMASIFHEDTRYIRKGAQYGFWHRFAHAAASGFVTGKDSGGQTFNWSNLTGTAISVGISNVYYPPASRNDRAMAIHFATSLVGAGLGNLAPEFWPDFHHWLRRHHLARSSNSN